MTIRIYGLPFSTYTITALMTCAEKGADYELDGSGLTPIANARKPPHIKRHPFAKFPAMQDGDFLLYETSAICRYIDEKFDGPPLLPANARDRALTEQWISAIKAYLDESLVRRFILKYAFPRTEDGKPDRAAIDAAIPGVRRALRILDAGYGEDGYLVAGQLTLADLFLAPIIAYLARTPEGPGLLARAPKVQRGMEAMAVRPGFRATMPPPA